MSTLAKLHFEKLLAALSKCNNPKWFFTFNAEFFDVGTFKRSVGKNGELILNIGPNAIRDLELDDEAFSFSTMASGLVVWLTIPYKAIQSFAHPDIFTAYAWPWFFQEANYDHRADPTYAGSVMETVFTSFFDFVNGKEIESIALFPMDIGLEDPLLTPLQKASRLGISVIEGGQLKPEVDPTIAAIHSKRKAFHTKLVEAAEIEVDTRPFGDLDITKCIIGKRKVKRPEWLTVVQGGKA